MKSIWKGKDVKAAAKVDRMSSRIKKLQSILIQSATCGKLYQNTVLIDVSLEQSNLLDRACFGILMSQMDTNSYKYKLSLEEAFYMHHYLKCINIIGEDNISKRDDELWECMKLKSKGFLELYIAYSYFRSKNWVACQGYQFGVDFVVYRHHPDFVHSEFAVIISSESKGFNYRLKLWSGVYCTVRLSSAVAKTLVDFHINWAGNNPLFPSCLEECTIKIYSITRVGPENYCRNGTILETDSGKSSYPNRRRIGSMLQLGFLGALGLINREMVLKWLVSLFSSVLQFLSARINISIARWDAKMCLAEIIDDKGGLWTKLGIIHRGKLYCSILEILYLTEQGTLHLFDANDAILSKRDVYDMFEEKNNGFCWESFKAYMHLKSMGYVVGRHGVPWIMKTNENIGVIHRDSVENATLVGDMHINKLKPVFDVYNPNSKFRESSPDDPCFILCLTNRSGPPSCKALDDLVQECNGIPLGICHIERGRVSIFFFNKMEHLPL